MNDQRITVRFSAFTVENSTIGGRECSKSYFDA